jgi:ribonuclease Z
MDLKQRAREVKHMCAAEAAGIARAAGARRLALTHISPRFDDATPVAEEARAVFAESFVVNDLDVVKVPYQGA